MVNKDKIPAFLERFKKKKEESRYTNIMYAIVCVLCVLGARLFWMQIIEVEEVFIITNSVQKVNPGDINNQIPIKEPAMNPNEQQASDGDTPVVPAKGE